MIGRTAISIIFFLCATRLFSQSSKVVDSSFADTTGGYKFMYLTTNCFECSPKGLVYYKKFIIISAIYKVKDFYSHTAALSTDHFKARYEEGGYFKDKTTQIWKSPQLFNSLPDVKEYRNDLISKLKSENYIVVAFDENYKPEDK